MDLIIYSTLSKGNQKHLEDLFKPFFPKEKIEVYGNFDNFSQRLKMPSQSTLIAVLAPGSRQGLREFLSGIDFLHDLRIIIIAPDHDVETTAIAHQLRPRYLTYLNGDFNELAAVVDKMVRGHISDQDHSLFPAEFSLGRRGKSRGKRNDTE